MEKGGLNLSRGTKKKRLYVSKKRDQSARSISQYRHRGEKKRIVLIINSQS